ncbi:MAG: helix-turn-helix domain-containing protein [[Ruminococcus] lactaris]|jgi:transcriptional regulator with XRE-family HTH domain|uniref:helix-turn-helix domain-containing protein n=1 Tax=[Ruminococcus] lactaris TaxID=46228 RepID=UPI003992F7F0
MNTDIKNEMNEENEKKSENREKVKIMMYANFGEFINKKRVEKKITLRKMADMLGVSAPFLTDVEKDRRNPFDMEKLTQLAKILNLSKEENAQMLDLAGKKRNAVAPDLPEYIMERDYVSAALRTARDLDAGEEEWNRFVEELRKRKG